jgi:disulfide bond formation protein DsbB
MSRPVTRGRGIGVDQRLGFMAVASIAAVAAALISQHSFEMEPCPWCVLQRVIFLGVALAAVIGLVWRGRAGRVVAGTVAALLSLAGIAAALWQHFYAAASASCNLTLADKIMNALSLPSLLPDVFSPRASCADAAVSLLGVPYDFWSLGLFVVLGLTALSVLRRERTPAR